MGRFTAGGFFYEQFSHVPPPLHVDLGGKTVVVTGANTGVGLEAAKHFARMKPARLIVACRSEEKGRIAIEEIAKTTSYAAELQLVDQADFASVNAFAERLKDDPVDILIANAGVSQQQFFGTRDGWEQSLQVNYLSSALLAFLLLPNMWKAAVEHNSLSRLVLLTSDLHFLAHFDETVTCNASILRALNDQRTPDKMRRRYMQTKAFLVIFARALTAHLPHDAPVVATAVNPGFCKSGIRRDLPQRVQLVTRAMELLFSRSAEQGARQLLRAALGPDGTEGPHVRYLAGAYVSSNEVHEPSDFVVSREGYDVQERVWHETIDVLSEISPLVREVSVKYCGTN